MRRNKAAFLWICLAIVVAIVCISHAVAEETKEITCTGKVVDAGGRPIVGAKVFLYQTVYNEATYTRDSKLASEVRSDAEGAFFFSTNAESNGSLYGHIVAEKEGLALGLYNWNMREGNIELDIELGPLKRLAGIVVDQSGKPVSGAIVSFSMLIIGEGEQERGLSGSITKKLFTANADTAGKFAFTGIPADATAEFLVKKAGKATINTYQRTGYAVHKLKYAPGQTDIKLVLPVEATIEGIVVAKDTGESISSVSLIVMQEANRPLQGQDLISTKEDGTFTINALHAGNYIIQLVLSQQETAEWVAEPVSVSIEAGQIKKDVKIELCKGGLLEVLVTEAETKKPLEGASVSVYDQRRRQSYIGRTGNDGVGRIRLLPGLYQSGYAHKQGFSTAHHQGAITAEEGTTKRLEWQLTSLPTVTGIVRDNNGKPIKGATLKVCPMGGMDVKSDAEGKYQVSWDSGIDIHERQPVLICRYEVDNLAIITTIPEGATILDLDLKPAVIVTGKVVNPDGKGINDARIGIMLRQTTWGSSMARKAAKTDAEGNFEIKAIPVEHNYDLIFNAKGYGSKRINIHADDVIDNRLKVGVLTLPVANLAVSGLVVDTKGDPIDDARIESYNYKGGQPEPLTVQTDSQGKFTIDGVCEGELNIRVNADHDGKRLSAYAITNGGASGIKIVVREGRSVVQYFRTKNYEQIIQSSEKVLAGVALDENGSPVEGVPVGVCCIKRPREQGKFSWTYSSYSTLSDITDEQGRFAIELEEDAEYNLRFSPDNQAAIIIYDIPAGNKDLKVTLPEGGTVTGRLMRMEKGRKVPVPHTEVKIEQTDRASYTHLGFDRDRTTFTDSQGRFRFEHIRTKIRPSGSRSEKSWDHVPRVWQISHGDTSKTIAFYDGTTIEDFELVVKPSLTDSQSLVGGVLPGFDGIKMDLSANRIKDNAMLVCFFDMNQRPSRNAIIQLARQAEELKQKGVTVIAIQVSMITEDTLNKWIKDQSISFPIGMVRGDEEEIRFTWGVRSLPWLILTGKEHIVRAEGFAISELDQELRQLTHAKEEKP